MSRITVALPRRVAGLAAGSQTRCALAWLACASLALGCHGVGRALVGERPVPQRGGDLCADPVPACVDDPQPDAPQDIPAAAEPIDLSVCGATRAAGCTLGDVPAVGANPAAASCDPETLPASQTNAVGALERRSCDALRIVDGGEPDARRVTVASAQLEFVNISIHTVLPLTLELESVSLQHVWLELHGPVTLRILSSLSFSDVRISAPDEVAARPMLELERVRGAGLSIGTSDAEFHGEVVIRRSTLAQVRMRASSIEMESVALTDAELETEHLEASDATLQRLKVSAGRTLLSVCTVASAWFDDCTAFSANAGTLRNSRIEGCSEGARLYGASFQEGVLDGQLVLDHANLSRVRLGLHERTDIAAWDAEFDYVRFCSRDQSLSFGGKSTVACSRCEGSIVQPRVVEACVSSTGTLEAVGGPEQCAAFVAPPICSEPELMRMRPPL